MLRFLYSVALALLLPVILFRLWWRGFGDARYREHVAERFGFYTDAPARKTIWIHAVSVGETRAAQPLVAALLARFPEHAILITSMTPTGRATANEIFAPLRATGRQIIAAHVPYDLNFAIARLIKHFSPVMLIVMETEIWPNLIASCRARDVPVSLVNARLSQRSADRYQRLWPITALARNAIGRINIVAAQTLDDAARFTALGARKPAVTGNLKFDAVADKANLDLGARWREEAGTRTVLLAASTREGEEKLLIEAYRDHTSADFRARALLVIVPRHPVRCDEVAALIAETGFTFSRRSQSLPDGAPIWLGDSMGELVAYYALCDVAFIGGSLVPMGAHNLIEAAAIGKPILIGESQFNFAEAAIQARAAGAALLVQDAAAWARACVDLADDPARRAAMGEAGRTFASAHRGATAKTVELVATLIARA